VGGGGGKTYLRSFLRDEFASGLWTSLLLALFSSLLSRIQLREVKSAEKRGKRLS
jgi:hypothetical protein